MHSSCKANEQWRDLPKQTQEQAAISSGVTHDVGHIRVRLCAVACNCKARKLSCKLPDHTQDRLKSRRPPAAASRTMSATSG